MNIKETKGITLIALAITIILLLILVGVVVNQLSSGNIIENAISVADKSKIASKKEEIQLAITNKMIEAEGDITIEDIIAKLEKNGIIESGNSNSENGQVKTKPDGYVYEIVQDKNGNWNVNYVSKGEIEATKITIATSVDTTGITNKVTITATAKAKSGIKSIQLPDGTSKTYVSGTTAATTTYEVTQNGTYKFTATNNNNESIDKTVAISNILEGEIAIAINPFTPTNKDVTATITWPSGNYSATKEVSTNAGTTYTAVTGTKTQINITSNCNIRARIKTASGEIKTQTYEVTNIDKTNPTVIAKQSNVTITEGDSNELSGYFDVVANGKYGISSIVYTDTSNNNQILTNTNTLLDGTHIIRCTATKETGAKASNTITIVVEAQKNILDTSNIVVYSNGSDYHFGTHFYIKGIPEGATAYYYYFDYHYNEFTEKKGSEIGTWVKLPGGSGEASELYVELNDAKGNTSEAIGFNVAAWCFEENVKVKTDNGDIKIKDIKAGDYVYSMNMDNKQVEIKKVRAKYENKKINEKMCVIYLENEKIESTLGHLYFVKNKGWITAERIKENDILINDKNQTKQVIKKEVYIKRGINIVYNLEVEDNHNYFVGKEHILVHNAPCIVGGEAPTEAPNSSNSVKLERKGN